MRRKPFVKGASLVYQSGKWYTTFSDLQERAYRDTMGAQGFDVATRQLAGAGRGRRLAASTIRQHRHADFTPAPSVAQEEAKPRFKWPWGGPTILSS